MRPMMMQQHPIQQQPPMHPLQQQPPPHPLQQQPPPHPFQQQPPQLQQQRFFNNNFNGNNNYNNGNRQKLLHHQPEHWAKQQYQQQTQQPASNPFIPLQASRKATKGKNLPAQKENLAAKKVAKQPAEVQAPIPAQMIKPIEPVSISASQSVIEPRVVDAKPAVDNRKSRLAINFGK